MKYFILKINVNKIIKRSIMKKIIIELKNKNFLTFFTIKVCNQTYFIIFTRKFLNLIIINMNIIIII